MNDLVTVIIPVYKVEPYLRKCLDSILAQSYQNLEIILIDDGSPDICGQICDEYARMDSRIKTIHKENEGLSAARNEGLKLSSGEYITFVDSDDWIETDMIEDLYTAAKYYKTEITIGGIIWEKDGSSNPVRLDRNYIYGSHEALYELILDDKIKNFAWGKLYKSSLFIDLAYPVGRTFEDILVTYQIIMRTHSIVCLAKPYYHYFRREDSIVGNWPLKARISFCRALQERSDEMINNFPEFSNLLYRKYNESWDSLIKQLPIVPRKEMRENIEDLKRYICPFIKHHKKALSISKKGMVKSILFSYFPSLLKKALWLRWTLQGKGS